MKPLMRDLLELRMTKVAFQSQKHLSGLVESLHAHNSAQYLMKLALTDINLANDRIVQSVIDLLHDRKHIQFFDVQNTRLKPRHIYEVTLELADKYM